MRLYRYRRIFALLAIGAMATIGITNYTEPKPEPIFEEVYIIKDGDTLWKIASERTNDNINIQEYIFDIKKSNPHIDSELHAGEKIIIRTKKLADNCSAHQL